MIRAKGVWNCAGVCGRCSVIVHLVAVKAPQRKLVLPWLGISDHYFQPCFEYICSQYFAAWESFTKPHIGSQLFMKNNVITSQELAEKVVALPGFSVLRISWLLSFPVYSFIVLVLVNDIVLHSWPFIGYGSLVAWEASRTLNSIDDDVFRIEGRLGRRNQTMAAK